MPRPLRGEAKLWPLTKLPTWKAATEGNSVTMLQWDPAMHRYHASQWLNNGHYATYPTESWLSPTAKPSRDPLLAKLIALREARSARCLLLTFSSCSNRRCWLVPPFVLFHPAFSSEGGCPWFVLFCKSKLFCSLLKLSRPQGVGHDIWHTCW